MKNSDPNINSETPWHAGQRRRVLRCVEKIETWPQPLKGLVGAKLISLSNAIDSLSGKPRSSSNHEVVAKMLGDLEATIDTVRFEAVVNA